MTTYQSSKGPILISEMGIHHLRNAVAKNEREWPTDPTTLALRAELDRRDLEWQARQQSDARE